METGRKMLDRRMAREAEIHAAQMWRCYCEKETEKEIQNLRKLNKKQIPLHTITEIPITLTDNISPADNVLYIGHRFLAHLNWAKPLQRVWWSKERHKNTQISTETRQTKKPFVWLFPPRVHLFYRHLKQASRSGRADKRKKNELDNHRVDGHHKTSCETWIRKTCSISELTDWSSNEPARWWLHPVPN